MFMSLDSGIHKKNLHGMSLVLHPTQRSTFNPKKWSFELLNFAKCTSLGGLGSLGWNQHREMRAG